jgi:Tfp pilus assembly protein PilW
MTIPELLVGTVIGALIMTAVVSTIYTTNDLRLRADHRSRIAGDVAIIALTFDRDATMATAAAPARSQAASTTCATAINLGWLEGGAAVRFQTVAGSPEGPLHLQRVSGASTRTIVRNVASCTWQAVSDAGGRTNLILNLTLTTASGESASQTLRASPRLW